MSLNNNKRIDLWELTGRGCWDLAKYSIGAIGVGAFVQTEIPIGKLVLIALAFAAGFIACAVVCFNVYNNKIDKIS